MMTDRFKDKAIMQRQKIIAGNWKMYKTLKEGIEFIAQVAPKVAQSGRRVLIAPSFTALSGCVQAAKGTNIQIGAQNMSDREEGPLTGEVSAWMLQDVGAAFVLLGHSERRTFFFETDESIHQKLKLALSVGITPILCIGEREEERGESQRVLEKQLDGCLGSFRAPELRQLILAYEPVWAIGTGKTATPEIAQKTHQSIRLHMSRRLGSTYAERLPILYGGSVKPNNIGLLLKQPDIDGALIGGAALDPEAFTQMVLE